MSSVLQEEKLLFDRFWRGTFKAVATPRPESVIITSITARRQANSPQRAECHLILPEVRDCNLEFDEKRSCEAEQERYRTFAASAVRRRKLFRS
ncbi:Serine/arginine repetitive matrix protein 4 [Bagarius yarrelli]|uniref:Serine/arginine repetitive matrix protein 4 n=1 Tax=Bagarius yarrelli TaxID=175774 RepID=A0A556VBC6_BAGYA|nr:Serine/arginine repetitive matrix protein 4 [Bagarius yarrelli]